MAKMSTYQKEIEALATVLDALADLEKDQREFVMRSAMDRLGLPPMRGRSGADGEQDDDNNGGKNGREAPASGDLQGITPKKFIDQKKPTTDVERIACLAYYLSHARKQLHFKTVDITQLNTDAAQPKFVNPSYSVRNATTQNRFLAPASKGQKQISSLGEKVVMALPVRDAVKRAIEDARARRRGRKPTTKKS